jgi:hypothetical protein
MIDLTAFRSQPAVAAWKQATPTTTTTMKHLIKLTEKVFVNPAHVTCLLAIPTGTRVWVKQDAGYSTGCHDIPNRTPAEIAAILNQEV